MMKKVLYKEKKVAKRLSRKVKVAKISTNNEEGPPTRENTYQKIPTQRKSSKKPPIYSVDQDLISLLSNYSGGITIHNDAYNVFCYADDLIIASLSVTGLQEMIYAATSYIVDHGLNFNPAKTICKTFGSCNFKISPKWYINDCLLTSDNSVTYLGTTLTGNVTDHIDTRIKSARRAYYWSSRRKRML